MKTRIISGAVAFIILFVIMQLPPFFLGIGIFIASLVALREFYHCVMNGGFNPVKFSGYLICTVILVYSMAHAFAAENAFMGNLYRILYQQDIIYLIIYISVFCLLLHPVFNHKRFALKDIAVTMLGIVYIPFLLSFIFMVRIMDYGYELTWLIFIGTFTSDIFAYFTGKFFGKKKLLPEISPHKTVAGGIGGISGSVVCTTIYGIFYINNSGLYLGVLNYLIVGLLCGIIAQLGDWAASAIKRSAGIKDFGNIMPGHGGILDRIDSLLFVAPAVYFYLRFFIQ